MRASLQALNVKYVIEIRGESWYAEVGPWLLVAGAMAGFQETLLSARVWDLADGANLGTITVKAKGKVSTAQWIAVAHVWPETTSGACNRLGEVLHSALTTRQ